MEEFDSIARTLIKYKLEQKVFIEGDTVNENVEGYVGSIRIYDSERGKVRGLNHSEKRRLSEQLKVDLNPDELVFDETLNRARKLTSREVRKREEMQKAYETW